MPASRTSRLDEPLETNGSGTPVSGARPSTAKTLSSAWERMSAVMPVARSAARAARGAQAAVADQAVEEQQRPDAEHAELLADHREDEVGVRLGQEEDLLDRGAQPAAGQAARADGDLALDGLEAGAVGVRPRVQERRQPRAPVGLGDREERDEQRADRRAGEQEAERHAGG